MGPKFSEGDKSFSPHAGLIACYILQKILILDQTFLNSLFSKAEVAKQCIVWLQQVRNKVGIIATCIAIYTTNLYAWTVQKFLNFVKLAIYV